MTERLEIIITAKDKASKVFGAVADSSEKLFRTATKGAAILGGGLAAGLALSVKEAMNSEVVFAKLDSVIESTGGVAGVTSREARDLADELSRVTRYSNETVAGAETLLLTFTNIGEDVFPQATETVLNMGEAFGGVEAASIQLGKALNDPVIGVGALREVGVSFTEEQQNLINSLVETGDIAGAQAVILAELEKEFGGMARAAGDTAQGKLTIFKNRLLDVATVIGSVALPYLTRFVERALLPMADAFEAAFSALPMIINQIESLVAAARNFGVDSQAFQTMADALGIPYAQELAQVVLAFEDLRDTLSKFATETVIPFIQDHWPAFKAALIAVGAVLGGALVLGAVLSLAGALATLLNPITLVIAGVALLAAAWAEDFLGIRTAVTEAWNDHIKPALESLGQWLSTAIPVAVALAKWAFDAVLKPAWEAFSGFVTDTLLPAIEKIPGILADLPGMVSGFIESLTGLTIPEAWENLKIGVQTIKNVLSLLWNSVMPGFIEGLEFVLPVVWQTFRDIVSFVWGGLLDFKDNVLPLFIEGLEFVLPVVWETFKGIISFVWGGLIDLKDNVLPLFIAALEFALPVVWETLKNIVEKILGAIQAIPGAVDSFIGALAKIEVPGALQSIYDLVTKIIDSLGDITSFDVPEWMKGGISPFGAEGAFLRKGERILVGERGPEPFVAPFDGWVMPNRSKNAEAEKKGGGNTYNLTVITSGSGERITDDFRLMEAWAGNM